jgi:hypothetical protein
MFKLCPFFPLPLYLVATGLRTIQFLFIKDIVLWHTVFSGQADHTSGQVFCHCFHVCTYSCSTYRYAITSIFSWNLLTYLIFLVGGAFTEGSIRGLQEPIIVKIPSKVHSLQPAFKLASVFVELVARPESKTKSTTFARVVEGTEVQVESASSAQTATTNRSVPQNIPIIRTLPSFYTKPNAVLTSSPFVAKWHKGQISWLLMLSRVEIRTVQEPAKTVAGKLVVRQTQ